MQIVRRNVPLPFEHAYPNQHQLKRPPKMVAVAGPDRHDIFLFLALAQQRSVHNKTVGNGATTCCRSRVPRQWPDQANQKSFFPDIQRVIPFRLLMNQEMRQAVGDHSDHSVTFLNLFFSSASIITEIRWLCWRWAQSDFSLSGTHIQAPHENRKFAGPSTLLLISVQFLEIPAGCRRALV